MANFLPPQKLGDGPLMAKWKKPGYERLCSTYVINSKNYKFGTVSICRVSESYALSSEFLRVLSRLAANVAVRLSH